MLARLRRGGTALYRDETGVVMLETVLVFPLQLMLTMVIIQIAHMYVASNVLQYASFQGTRTYALDLAEGEEAATLRGNRAAWTIASAINATGGDDKARMVGYQYRYPSWAHHGSKQMRMAFTVGDGNSEAPETIVAGELLYWLDLNVPVGGPVVYHVLPARKTSTRPSPYGSIGRVLMHQNSRLPKPWPR